MILFSIGGLVFAVVGYLAGRLTVYIINDFHAHQRGAPPIESQCIVHLSTQGDLSVYEFTHPETNKRYLIVYGSRGSLSVTVE